MIQIRLGPYEPVDPATDPLGREHIGFCADMTEEHAWQVGRGVWKLAARRVLGEDEVQIVNLEGTVLAVATITGISKYGDRGNAPAWRPSRWRAHHDTAPVAQLRRLLLTQLRGV